LLNETLTVGLRAAEVIGIVRQAVVEENVPVVIGLGTESSGNQDDDKERPAKHRCNPKVAYKRRRDGSFHAVLTH
jgi:hypothetical protein